MNYMRGAGLPYPKACEECGLGPCRYPQHQEKPVAEIKHVYYTAAELAMIRQAGGPPPPGAAALGLTGERCPCGILRIPGQLCGCEMEQRKDGPPKAVLPDALSQPLLKKWQPRVVQIVSHGDCLIALMDDGKMLVRRWIPPKYVWDPMEGPC
jgi:hypothetical protein